MSGYGFSKRNMMLEVKGKEVITIICQASLFEITKFQGLTIKCYVDFFHNGKILLFYGARSRLSTIPNNSSYPNCNISFNLGAYYPSFRMMPHLSCAALCKENSNIVSTVMARIQEVLVSFFLLGLFIILAVKDWFTSLGSCSSFLALICQLVYGCRFEIFLEVHFLGFANHK